MRTLLLLLPLISLHLGAAPATDLEFGPDGLAILATGRNELRILPVARGQAASIPCELPRVLALDFDSDFRRLVCGGGAPGESGTAVVLDWETKRAIQRHTNFDDWVTCAAMDPGGKRFVAGSADASATICASESAKEIALRGHTAAVLGAAWSLDGDLVVTASADRSLKVWSAAEGDLLRSFSHHTEAVQTVVFRPKDEAGGQCASGSDDRTVRIWQPKIGRMVRIVRGHDGPVFALAYTPDGASLFSAGKEGVIRRIDADSDEILGEWKAHDEPIYSLAIDSKGSILATGDWSGAVKLWRFAEGRLNPL